MLLFTWYMRIYKLSSTSGSSITFIFILNWLPTQQNDLQDIAAPLLFYLFPRTKITSLRVCSTRKDASLASNSISLVCCLHLNFFTRNLAVLYAYLWLISTSIPNFVADLGELLWIYVMASPRNLSRPKSRLLIIRISTSNAYHGKHPPINEYEQRRNLL